MYCEKCMRLFDGAKCPECGAAGREPEMDDWCLASEIRGVFAEMYADVLRQEHIPFMTRGALGAALTAIVGTRIEVTSYYVPFSCLAEAKTLAAEFFGAGEA